MTRIRITVFLFFLFSVLTYAQISYEISISKNEFEFISRDGYDIIQLPGYDMTNITAAPSLPVKALNFIIPPNKKVKDIIIDRISEEELDGKFLIYPAQPEKVIGYDWVSSSNNFTEPDSGIYSSNKYYPGKKIVNTSQNYFSGAKIIGLQFYPLHFNPATGKVKLITQINFTIRYENDINTSIKPNRLSNRSNDHLRKMAKKMVSNPESVDMYFQFSGDGGENQKTSKIETTEIPSLVGNNIDYVIITNEALKNQFIQICEWKTKKGLPSVIRTVEWIYDHYTGVDGPEKIRNFIKDANAKWGTLWFLLGGDNNIVPLRYAWISHFNNGQLLDLVPNGEFIPIDMYYSCLDGNWNADGDATFGEADWDRQNDGTFVKLPNLNANIDDVDRVPDVFLGRIPVESTSETNNFLTKYFEYLTETNNNENNVLLFSANSNGIHSSYMNTVGYEFPTSTTSITKLYENYGHTKNDVLDALNVNAPYPNFHIICGFGHGNYYRYEACLNDINKLEMSSLLNTDRSQILYLNHCQTMGWDRECIAEEFINSINGGVAVIGNTRFGWSSDPLVYNDAFIGNIYNGFPEIVEALYLAKVNNSTSAYYDGVYRWRFFSHNISADPEMPVWTDIPQNLIVSHPTSVNNGQMNFSVTINNLPIYEEAIVCLKKDMEDYAYQSVTGTGGPVSVNFDFTPDTDGILDVTVTTHNFLPYEAQVPVNIAGGIHLFITDKTVDDDGIGPSNGNNDVSVDAGETIELSVSVQNSGSTDAMKVEGTLTCSSSYVSIVQSYSYFGSISAGMGANSQSDYVLSIDENTPDGESIEFILNIVDDDGAGDTYEDKFYLQISASEFEMVKNIVDYAVIQPDEVVEFYITLQNLGYSEGVGLSANISSTSAYVSVIFNSSSNYPNIAPFETGANFTGFQFEVSPSYAGQTIEFQLEVNNSYGKQWLFNFDLDRPAPVTDFGNFDNYLNEIDLYWGNIAGVRGYNIYRSLTELGIYNKINKFIIDDISYYKDSGLNELSDYYYKISSISSCGNESELTNSFRAWTSLPYMQNWPIYIDGANGSIWGGITLEDVDNDNEQEIFMTNTSGFALAWNHDGTELFDIDDNTTTVSGFYNFGGETIFSTPAIVDINNDSKKEIIITTRKPAKAYVFNAEDNNSDRLPDMVTGWPQALSSVTTVDEHLRGAVVSDLNGDGFYEIIAHSEGNTLDFHVFDYAGNSYAPNSKTIFFDWSRLFDPCSCRS